MPATRMRASPSLIGLIHRRNGPSSPRISIEEDASLSLTLNGPTLPGAAFTRTVPSDPTGIGTTNSSMDCWYMSFSSAFKFAGGGELRFMHGQRGLQRTRIQTEKGGSGAHRLIEGDQHFGDDARERRAHADVLGAGFDEPDGSDGVGERRSRRGRHGFGDFPDWLSAHHGYGGEEGRTGGEHGQEVLLHAEGCEFRDDPGCGSATERCPGSTWVMCPSSMRAMTSAK